MGNPHLVLLGPDPADVDVAAGRRARAVPPGAPTSSTSAVGPGADELDPAGLGARGGRDPGLRHRQRAPPPPPPAAGAWSGEPVAVHNPGGTLEVALAPTGSGWPARCRKVADDRRWTTAALDPDGGPGHDARPTRRSPSRLISRDRSASASCSWAWSFPHRRRPRSRPTWTSWPCWSTRPGPTSWPGSSSVGTTPDPATFVGRGKAEELHELSPGRRRRHRRLRRRAVAGPAAQPGEDPRAHGHRPHRGDPRHLRPERPQPRRQGPGRAGPAALPAAPPAGPGPVLQPAGRWHRHPGPGRDPARGGPAPPGAPHGPTRGRPPPGRPPGGPSGGPGPGRGCGRCRWSATPTPASRRCSTG